MALTGRFWVFTVAPGGGRGSSLLPQATSFSQAILPSAAAPPGSRHTLRAPQLRGARSDHCLIFVPLFQQAWKQDTQERHCQQRSPLSALSAGEAPTPPPLPASAGANLLQNSRASNALLPKKSHATSSSRAPYQASKEATLTCETKATGPDT